MNLNLEGRRALVCGASSGLGFATALSLATEGCEVVINSRSVTKLNSAADRIEKACGWRPKIAVGDVGSSDAVDAILDCAGAIDILVSNNGGPRAGRFGDVVESDWMEAGELLLHSAVRLTRGVIDGMVERRFGRLIFITSIAAIQPVDDLILSNSYRAGITGFCKTISNTYAEHGITANTVCPGYTKTERLLELGEKRAQASGRPIDEIMAEFAAAVPAKRLGEPEELASLITLLASERAGYITGCSIPVDGGAYKALI
jgi:3-oxoacyl-[acyl-carrier protein] reductase